MDACKTGHYAVLNVARSASTHEVRQAYHRLALEFHPDRSSIPETTEKFKEISQAYSVLGDPLKRNQYDCSLDLDQFFKDPFKDFMDDISGSTSETMDLDAPETLSSLLKELIVDHESTISPNLNMNGPDKDFKSAILKEPPIYKDLNISLEEIYTGTVKKLKLTRNIVLSNGFSKTDENVLEINIIPGSKAGTTKTFTYEGNQKPDTLPADIIFTIKDKQHQHFTRDSDNNLIYHCKMSLRDALINAVTDIPTIDGRTLTIQHNDVIRPGSQTILPGHGLPLPNQPNKRANLIVNYDIIFPQHLSSQQRQVISYSLPN